METFKTGFNKEKFEGDHFGFKRGSREKYFHGWGEVRYEGGLSPYAVNERELADGNMTKPLYEFLEHLYGAEQMAEYFPKEKESKKPQPMLHFGVGSAMAAHVDGKKSDTMPSGVMTEDEVDALAAIM